MSFYLSHVSNKELTNKYLSIVSDFIKDENRFSLISYETIKTYLSNQC